MAFLFLNGWQIPIKKGGQRQPVIIGERARSFSGSFNVDRREVLDKWMLETVELPADDADSLVALLHGLGHSWAYDSDLYSSKGLGPGGTSGTIRPATAIAPVAQMIDNYQEEFSKYGSAGSLAVEDTMTNILPAATREASSTAGFSTYVGGTLATDTNYAALDTGEGTPTCIKHTRTALGQGVETNGQGISGSTDYAGSVYVMTLDSGIRVNVELNDDIDNIDGSGGILTPGVWQRFAVVGTSDPTATTASLRVYVQTGAAAGDIYIDALQIEQRGDWPTTWYGAGGGTRPAVNPEYQTTMLAGADGVTFAAWIKMWSGITSSAAGLFHLYDSAAVSERLRLARGAGVNELQVLVSAGGSTVTNLTLAGPWDNGWHHVAVTLGRNAVGQFQGNPSLRLYVDGALADSSFGFTLPEFALMDMVAIGNYGTPAPSLRLGPGGMIDDVMVLPYVASANMIAGLASQSAQPPGLPKLLASGAAVGEGKSAAVEGRVVNRSYNPIYLAGSFQDDAQRIQFEIER